MSKNFELLQQIGGEDVFRTADDAVAGAEVRTELNMRERDRVLRHASLPDVFQISGQPMREIEAASFQSSASPAEETERGDLSTVASVNVFRTSRNLHDATVDAESLLAHEGSSQVHERFVRERARPTPPRRVGRPRQDESAESSRPYHDEEKTAQNGLTGRPPFLAHWVGLLATQAKNWKWKLLAEKHRHRTELGAIARDEEIKLVQSVFPETNQEAPRIALFAGLENESGCAWICARTAEILAARADGSVCVVDANFQSPDLHRCFGAENTKGLAEATLESGPIQNCVQRISGSNLWLMPSGKASLGVTFPASAESLRARIVELRDTFRYVIIRSGPLRLDANAMLLSRWTDGVVLVLEANSTRRESARRMKESLASANVPVLGVVLNNRRYPIPRNYYRRF